MDEKFDKNYLKLSKNDWELHKKYVKEGANPNEIAKMIRNDEIENFQEISSQNDFDFNQTIEPSLYERCSFINQRNVTLIDYAAFFGSVKCFKYLLINNANLTNTGKYAIASGNLEIIHLCEQNHSSFEDVYETTVKFHRNEIFKYIYENKSGIHQTTTYLNKKQIPYKNLEYYINNAQSLSDVKLQELIYYCINNGNYEIFSILEEKIKFDENIINVTAKTGNLYLVKHFLQKYHVPKYILLFATEAGNIELVQYILEQEGVDINIKDICFFVIKLVFLL